jgi:hypothetical protein
VVSEQTRIRVRTCYYYRQNKILLKPERFIIIDRTSLYVISNKKKVSEQMRTTVRTKSYYSLNNFVCHLEQKTNIVSEQIRTRIRTNVIIART